ncbi:hypothetical protein HPB50_024758 [Hyalomma asiaticum]|uniref:Uncharacterized protein n=1 Tax=Hyalomma asiaticum TaxID=266040 RepID=A0ACB7T1X3_HYAAI|nr:hypothetical protein HPB50_024758 [Hyalomma asiaticum]
MPGRYIHAKRTSSCEWDHDQHGVLAVAACGTLEPECLQPLERGSCDKLHGRFFYNATSRQCQEFFWKGCAENANNFENREDCEKECQHSGVPLPRPKGK